MINSTIAHRLPSDVASGLRNDFFKATNKILYVSWGTYFWSLAH